MSLNRIPRGKVEETKKEPVDFSGGTKRRNSFFRYGSSGDFSSDNCETTEGDVPPMGSTKRKGRRKIPSFLYKRRRGQRSNKLETKTKVDDEPETFEDEGKSHLWALMKNKIAVNKYANELLRTQDNDISPSGKETVVATFDATPAEIEEGKITAIGSRSNIDLPNDRRFFDGGSNGGIFSSVLLTDEQKEEAQKVSKGILLLQESFDDYSHLIQKFPIDVRIENLHFSAPYTEASSKITTVYNSSFVYKAIKKMKQLMNGSEGAQQAGKIHTKHVLDKVSLCLKPGKMYLVLGPPGSGKSSLLKAIAGRLHRKGKEKLKGSITYNGIKLYNNKGFYDQPNMHFENSISFIDQLDRHAPLYTVEETFNFAFQCKRRNGRHIDFRFQEDTTENRELAKKADDNNLLVDTFIKILGIDHVRDTFVGNDEIRGVSGGQRRRVTIGEMLMSDSPIICGDEISNGLDARSTFEIITAMSYIGKVREKLQVISLLQPSPEIVSLFDEIILIAKGKILYAGPVQCVESYFASLGYVAPMHMDVGDFLQIISTPDGADLYDPPPDIAMKRPNSYSLDDLADEFRKSRLGQRINVHLNQPNPHLWGSFHGTQAISGNQHEPEYLDDRNYKAKYQNNFAACFFLNLKRQITLWRRDKRVLITNAVKNFIMGISVGFVFYQTNDVISVLGVLFQGMMFVMLGGMGTAPAFVNERLIYYKQNDANYFGAFSFVFAKAISKLPQTAMDCFFFGTILYYMVGFCSQPIYYVHFLGIVFLFNVLMSEFLFIFSTFAATSSVVQTAGACAVFIFMLFCGFLIPPVTIPSYFGWIYWYNPLAWAYRALVVNAFRNDEYTREEANEILKRIGFVYNDGEPFDRKWITWAYIFMCAHIFLSVLISALILTTFRVETKSPPSFDSIEEEGENVREIPENNDPGDSQDVNIPFKSITLSFESVCYDVKASTGDEDIRILHDVNGHFRAGRLCALMGESGAGKTTLMDVIGMRKNSGTVSGDIHINGFPQERSSFRRCSGYVEQFDIQSPQLTVRETVLFSACLRLDSSRVKTDKEKELFCDTVIKTLELTPLAHCLVGSDEEGGLSFEQKKRLSIAVELAASPSVIFLDEPTTGLDARSASLVVKLLRKIADQGRTICATVHQPSSAVFDMFDDILLLKKGGHSVYFGELGYQSETLIRYFEGHGAPKIKPGDNPANWMLRLLQECNKDFSEIYIQSSEYSKLKCQVSAAKLNPPEQLEIAYLTEFAVPRSIRQKLTNARLQTIYWRSPAYNLSRLMVCCLIAFILGSVFVTERKLEVLTENQVKGYFSITFLSFIITGILSMITVLPVMLEIRNVFYKQLAAGMIDNYALGWALGFAEKNFILLASFLFCLIYLATAGTFPVTFFRAFKFWGFFTFNIAMYSYFGQAFMCLAPTMATAQILSSVFIGINNIFSGLIVRPQYLKNVFAFSHWITPGHFVYEGLILSQYWGDQRTVRANIGSEFYVWLGCDPSDNGKYCEGTVEQYVWVFFGGKFHEGNLFLDILVLALFLVLSRIVTFSALRKFQYTNT